MKKISILLALSALIITSCKNKSNIEYKYEDNPDLFVCESINMNLIKEALYAFEDYIEKHYSFQNPKSVEQGYFYYWEIAKTDRIPAVEFINTHVLSVRDELKKIDDLWIIKNEKTTLNYKHPLLKCLGSFMIDPDMKRTYNVLIDSNTFKEEVFLALLKRDPKAIQNDRALATYLSLDSFYARILALDFSKLEELKKINENRFRKKQDLLIQQEMENIKNGQLIPIDSLK